LKLKHVEDYRKLRRQEYPSVQEQLDSLWHSMNEQSDKKIEPFYSIIKAVKDKYPKEPK
jgi:hypothetical protein